MNKTTQKKTRNAGFSLVELIIVIAIMAIIVGALAPMLIRYIDKTRRSKDVDTAKQIRLSLQKVMIDTNFEPASGQTTIRANHTTTYNDPAQSLQDELFIELGGVPRIASEPDYYWYITCDTKNGAVIEVHLTDTATGQPKYELFPDYSDFLEEK